MNGIQRKACTKFKSSTKRYGHINVWTKHECGDVCRQSFYSCRRSHNAVRNKYKSTSVAEDPPPISTVCRETKDPARPKKKKKKQRVGDSCWFLFIYSLILIHCRRQGSEKLLVNGNAFSINHWKLIFPSPTPFHSFPNISTNCACLCVCDVGWHFLVLFWKLLCLALIDFQLFSSLLAGN